MRTILLTAALLTGPGLASAQNFAEVKPSPQQAAWQDLEMGAIFHFGTNTFLNREWGDGTAPAAVFRPAHVDTDQWIAAAKSAGIRYVVLVAKHHDGFALNPTAQTPYSVRSSPWLQGRGDLVRMVSDSARAQGLRFGVYLSPWDRHDPRYGDAAAYDAFYLAMLEELATGYGELTEFWLDGAGSAGRHYDFDTILQHLRTYQPNTLVFADVDLYKYGDIRWVGTESGRVDFENFNVVDRAGYLRWRPVEADTPLHAGHWFWHPGDEATLKSVPELVREYDQTVGRGAQLMLGLAPDDQGLLPAADVARLREFGERLRTIYQDDLVAHASCRGAEAACDHDPDTYWEAPAEGAGNHAPPALTARFPRPVTLDRAVSMERLNGGQHVTAYRIEAEVGGRWRELARGQAIGHKRIDVFPAVTATALRLTLAGTDGPVQIREFQAYNGGVPY
jgi:alpha-L-fucosidase